MLSFFPRDVLDEVLDLFESVSGDFPTCSCIVFEGIKEVRIAFIYYVINVAVKSK